MGILRSVAVALVRLWPRSALSRKRQPGNRDLTQYGVLICLQKQMLGSAAVEVWKGESKFWMRTLSDLWEKDRSKGLEWPLVLPFSPLILFFCDSIAIFLSYNSSILKKRIRVLGTIKAKLYAVAANQTRFRFLSGFWTAARANATALGRISLNWAFSSACPWLTCELSANMSNMTFFVVRLRLSEWKNQLWFS